MAAIKDRRYNEIDKLIASLIQKQDGAGLGTQSGTGLLDKAKKIADKIINWSPFTRRLAKAAKEKIEKRIDLMMQGRREGPTLRLQKFLEETFEHKVIEVKLARKPIVTAVKAALNLLSLGKFSKTANQLGYDDVYHQYLLVKLDNGKSYKIEKNEVIVQMDAKPDDYKHKIWDIKIPDGKDLTLKEMFENASKGLGKEFFQYDGSSSNCQIFSRRILESNGLLPDDPSDFTTQDSKSLMDSLPPIARKIADGVVDAAASIDRLVHGDGLQGKSPVTPFNPVAKKRIIPIFGGGISTSTKVIPIWGMPSYTGFHSGFSKSQKGTGSRGKPLVNPNSAKRGLEGGGAPIKGKPKIFGGASFRFNTQTPERMVEIQAKYKGQAHPDFIDQYADILNDRPRMYGWRGSIPSSEWYGEEHAAYLRDGRPKSKADIARIMGTVGNEREYSGNGLQIANMRPRLPPKKAQVYAGTLGGQHG
jgi:hypothetical protein